MRRFAPLAALVLASLLVAPMVLADDGWDDGERHVDTAIRPDGFSIVSDRVSGAGQDRIRLSLDGPNAEFAFELLPNASAGTAVAGLRIRLDRIVEFRDRNGDGALNASDEVIQGRDAGDLNLTGVAATNLTSNGVPGVQVTATYAFRDRPAATLAFRATAFDTPTTFENLGLRPVETKIDLVLGSFPYAEDDTLPAIVLRVDSETSGAFAQTPNALAARAGDVTATFGWKQVAIVDGVERPVGVTVSAEGNGTEVTVGFAYARGSAIEHDPTVGFTLAALGPMGPAILGSPLFYALGVLTAAAAFAGLAFARKGRKAKGS